jgi:mono/diheme cytochrome c family protein
VKLKRSGTAFLSLAAGLFLATNSSAQSDKPISAEDAKKLKSPIPYSKKSIAQGRGVFMRMCTGCHGNDGKSQVDVVADATDLTDPQAWRNGISEGEMFHSIRDGAGASMPAFKTQLRSEEDMWHLVNYVRSLWPESMRPPLQEAVEKK